VLPPLALSVMPAPLDADKVSVPVPFRLVPAPLEVKLRLLIPRLIGGQSWRQMGRTGKVDPDKHVAG